MEGLIYSLRGRNRPNIVQSLTKSDPFITLSQINFTRILFSIFFLAFLHTRFPKFSEYFLFLFITGTCSRRHNLLFFIFLQGRKLALADILEVIVSNLGLDANYPD
jgi:hypothetical protein